MICGYLIHHLLNGHGYLGIIQEINLENMAVNNNLQSIAIPDQDNIQHRSLIIIIISIYLEDLGMIKLVIKVNNNKL